MNTVTRIASSITFACSFIFNAMASPIACDAEFVTLDSIKYANSSASTNLLSSTYEASACGGYSGNDTIAGQSGNHNRGLLGDGLLNQLNSSTGYAYTDFISNDDLLALGADDFNSDPTAVNDPGWIYLGKSSGVTINDDSYGSITAFDGSRTASVDELLDLNVTCDNGGNACTSGSWTVDINGEDIINTATALLGHAAVFDHLAIVLKASNEFFVYDFDFIDIFGQEADKGNTSLNFFTPYTLTGSWYTGDITNKKGNAQELSHMSIWARDPILSLTEPPVPETNVNAPGTLALSLMGLLLMWRRRSQVSANQA